MTTRTSRHCRWTILAASVAACCTPTALVAAPFAPSSQDDAVDAAPGVPDAGAADAVPAGADELYLEVELNQFATGQLARFVMIDGRLHASATTLRELGLRWPGSETDGGLVALDSIPDLQARYDASLQRLSLVAPLEALSAEREHFGVNQSPPPRVDPATLAPGLLFNYNLYAQGGSDYLSFSGWNEMRLFGVGPGIWSNSLLTRLTSVSGRDDRYDTVRLDTYWKYDLPDSMVSVVAGDAYTGSLGWTRSIRFGGVRATRDFALQPYRVTTPLASFTGDAALPSTVDLFINGIRQSSQQVRPGQFQIDSVPVINGAGQAQMVITDITGQARVVNFALYNTSQLLQEGLADWSLEAGLVRNDYGIRSFSYADDPMGSATVRYGAGDHVTLEAHAEGTAGLQMAGMGGLLLLGDRGGVVNLSLAGSRRDGASGQQYGLGYQWSSTRFNLGADTLRRSDRFADVATLEGATLPVRMDRAFAGLTLGRTQLGASYVRQDYPDQPRARYANLSWSWQLPRSGYLSLNLSRDFDTRDSDSAYLYWSMPLGNWSSVSATAQHASGASNLTLEANRSVDADQGGWGWRAQTTVGDRTAAQAQVNRLGRYGAWDAGFFHVRGEDGRADSNSGFASASGSVLFMQRHLFAMRRVYDAFALVSTDGIAGVPILLENRPVGTTDEHGLLLVNRLNAWQNNRVSIDPLQAPTDVSLGRTETLAVPQSQSGMLVRFPMRLSLSVQATVTGGDGKPVAAGSPVWLGDADPATDPADTVVGYDGLLYLQNPPANARLKIRQNEGFCEAVLPDTGASHGFVELEEVICQ